jgi:hypothetical protein
MERCTISKVNDNSSERGAALVTVLLISVLLLTATIAMLTAVGENSRNTTDVLSETKAYYAAESGLQATINVLRNDSTMTYPAAVNNPTLAGKLPYNYPITGTPTRAVIGEDPATYSPSRGAAYSIQITDPDDSATRTSFATSGTFAADPTANPTPLPGATVAERWYPNATDANRTKISFTPAPVAESPINHPDAAPYAKIGTFRVERVGTGAASLTPTGFKIDFHMMTPRDEFLAIRGSITIDTGTPRIKFDTYRYQLMGAHIDLCVTDQCTGAGVAPVPLTPLRLPIAEGDPAETPVYAIIGPTPPYRLKVTSTGYGPNGATKQLEAIVQRNLFNGLANGAGTTMLGPPCTPGSPPLDYCFDPGTSHGVTYDGGECETTGCVPAFGFDDPTNYQTASGSPLVTSGQISPPPAILGNEIPDWQSSPTELDRYVDAARLAAQHDGRYLINPSTNVSNPGNYAAGTGVTFCEGSCKVAGDGGGLLVVTGKLTNVGGFNFRGLIVVIGEEGWERSGAGGGVITGNVVIAPYNRRTYWPENLSSTFLPPRYRCSGCGTSGIVYADVSASFDSISALSDLVAGVAEK